MNKLTLDAKDPYVVTGCKEVFREWDDSVQDIGRLDFRKGPDGEIMPCVVVGDTQSYQNLIEIDFKENDFGNMLAIMGMIQDLDNTPDDVFAATIGYSMNYEMPDPVIKKKRTDLEKSAGDMEYALMAHGDLTADTPLLNPSLSTINRLLKKFAAVGTILLDSPMPSYVRTRQEKIKEICREHHYFPHFSDVENHAATDFKCPIYYGQNGLGPNDLNGFALEINIYHPTVASSFIHGARVVDSRRSVLYKNGEKNCYLDYETCPYNFFRYHSDSYLSVYGKYLTQRNVRSASIGFYNLVTTTMRDDFFLIQQAIVPLPVEVENYYIGESTEAIHFSQRYGKEFVVLKAQGKVFDIKRPEARCCRKVMSKFIAQEMNYPFINPTSEERDQASYYTVAGSSYLFRHTIEHNAGVRNEIYENYQMIPSVVITPTGALTISVPYLTKLVPVSLRPKGPSNYVTIEDTHKVSYLVESFETIDRIMVDPVNSHWHIFDNKLRVLYDQPGDFVGIKRQLFVGHSIGTYANPIHKTYVETVSLEGSSRPFISFPKFIHALAGTYQEHYMWVQHKLAFTHNSLQPSLHVDRDKKTKHEETIVDGQAMVDLLRSIADSLVT